MFRLWSTAYTSSARSLLTDAQLEGLFVSSLMANRRDGITGVLLYDEGNFMQCLEGPRTAVDATYARIRKDPAHGNLVELMNEAIDKRSFSAWEGGLARPTGSRLLKVVTADWHLLVGERPDTVRRASGLGLMQSLWRSARRGL